MSVLPEFIGTVHIILGPYRGNPIGLYLVQEDQHCRIAPNIYPWNRIIGTGETTNKAAADFEAKWKDSGLTDEMYTGPHWEGGIKPEKPKPPPKAAAPPKPTPVNEGAPTQDLSHSTQSPPSGNPVQKSSLTRPHIPESPTTLEPTDPDSSSPTI